MNSQEQKYFYRDKEYITYVKRGHGATSIIFIHGYGISKSSWDDFYPFFDTTKYSLYLIDLKGFGNSSVPKDNQYSINDNEEILSQFINETINNDYFLIGHSYGGGIALLLSQSEHLHRYPKILVLMDCAAYNIDTPFFIELLKMPIVNELIFLLTTPKVRANFSMKRIVKRENFSQKIEDRYAEAYKGHNKKYTFIKTAKQIYPAHYEQLIDSYKNIKIPTLIIWGKQDNILSIEQGNLLNKQIANSEFYTIDNCGHIPPEEQPLETFKIVNEFIKNQEK